MIQSPLETRCLLCSLACPVAFQVDHHDGAEQVLTEYVADNPLTQGRLCFRGHYLAEMATHPLRLTDATARKLEGAEAGGRVTPDRAIAALAARLKEAGGRTAVLVDGNLPTADIVSVLRLATDVIGANYAAVYLPVPDAAMLRAISPETPRIAFSDVAESEVVLAVGDAFATHPVISRPILEARKTRKLKILGIDCMPNRLSPFAQEFLCVKPGAEAAALAALCTIMNRPIPTEGDWAASHSAGEFAEMAGLTASDLKPIATALSQAKTSAILLAPVPGRMGNVAATASMAAALCSDGVRLMPLFRYGNAVGAARAATTAPTVSWLEVVKATMTNKVDVLLTVGLDLLRMLSAEDQSHLRARVPLLAAASVMRNRTTESADVVLPLAAAFEEDGSIIDASGGRVELTALMSPPGGAMKADALCARVASAMDSTLPDASQVDLGEAFEGRPCPPLGIEEMSAQGLQLVARAAVPDFHLGALSRLFAWPAFLEPMPELHMNAADMKERHLVPRGIVKVRANGNGVAARLCIDAEVPPGMATVSTAFEGTRSLFRSRLVGPLESELIWSEADVIAEIET